ncbi:MAG: prepilin-type N-terminal cleavage/methylation domain-containing protein [Pseudomonadota bacterium]
MRASRHGFSLVELSIVLVILGLLVGGITAGRSMVRASEVRGIVTDAMTYAVGIQNFRDKYGALPGDMRDAQRIWGNAGGGGVNTDCTTPNTTASVGALTCNGDGDGFISESGTIVEVFRAWQQLSAAGLITGRFSGIPGPNSAQHSLFTGATANAPSSTITNAGFHVGSYGIIDATTPSTTTNFDGDYNNTLFFGRAVTDSYPNGTAITPSEAWGIDSKVDDEMPALGSIRSYKPYASMPNCVSGTTVAAVYNKTYADNACMLFFLNSFKARQ